MVKTAVILSSNFNQLTGFPVVFEGHFQDVERDFKQYKVITAFDRYWHVGKDVNNALNYDLINQFDAFFETSEVYQDWLNSTDIIPTAQVVEDSRQPSVLNADVTPNQLAQWTIAGKLYDVKMSQIKTIVNAQKNRVEEFIKVQLYLNNIEQKQMEREIEIILDNGTENGQANEFDQAAGLLSQGWNEQKIRSYFYLLRGNDGTIKNKCNYE